MKGVTESWLKQARAEGRITNELAVKLPPAGPVVEEITRRLVKRLAPPFPIVIDCPGLIVVSEANRRDHWRVQRKRARVQKDGLLLGIALARLSRPLIEKPIRVTLTRFYSGSGKLMDRHDNLSRAFKAVVDGLCGWLGLDDADDRLTFVYGQEKGVKGVRVEITEH